MMPDSLPIIELALIGVADPGVPNKERVIIRPTQPVSLAGFAVALGVFQVDSGGAKPIYDNIFWFPDAQLEPPGWILLYTGRGTPQTTRLPNGDNALTLFWQREHTAFENSVIVPLLIRLDAALIGPRL